MAYTVAPEASAQDYGIQIVVMCDATGSMRTFLDTLSPVLKDLFPMCGLLFQQFRMAVCFYRDFDSESLRNYVTVVSDYTSDETFLNGFITKHAHSIGGGDGPEAQKTALMLLQSKGMLNERTIVIHYTDAQPHADNDNGAEANGEQTRFRENRWSWKWTDIVACMKATGATLLTISNTGSGQQFYTNIGKFIRCTATPTNIMKTTMTAIQTEPGIDAPGNPNFRNYRSIARNYKRKKKSYY